MANQNVMLQNVIYNLQQQHNRQIKLLHDQILDLYTKLIVQEQNIIDPIRTSAMLNQSDTQTFLSQTLAGIVRANDVSNLPTPPEAVQQQMAYREFKFKVQLTFLSNQVIRSFNTDSGFGNLSIIQNMLGNCVNYTCSYKFPDFKNSPLRIKSNITESAKGKTLNQLIVMEGNDLSVAQYLEDQADFGLFLCRIVQDMVSKLSVFIRNVPTKPVVANVKFVPIPTLINK